MTSVMSTHRSRDALLRRLQQLAPHILFGTLSETYRTCGRPGCHCHQGQKHGPHLYVSFRGPEARTQGYYVPQALGAAMRAGVEAWQELQTAVRALALHADVAVSWAVTLRPSVHVASRRWKV